MSPSTSLVGVMQDRLRAKHYSPRTEEAYVAWGRRYVRYHRRRHPREMGSAQVREFLTHLAVDRHVSASTQNQALAREVESLASPMSHRFRNIAAMGNQMSVRIPTDERGLLGRECPVPECLGYFKVKSGTGLTGPGLQCHCPYCGHAADPQSFWTKEQIEYAKSVALQQFVSAVRKDLKQFEFDRPARGSFGIGISMKLQPGPLPPLRHYREKKLETDAVCDSCTLQYAVFGLFAYCPDCGIHNSLQVLQRNLALVEKQLDLATAVENEELARHLVEDGLENCVSAFDGFGRETCRVRAALSRDPSRAANLSFQNLVGAAKNVQAVFGADLASTVDAATWSRMVRAFHKRHLLAHRSGVIDERYVQSSGDTTAVVGRRVSITPAEVTDVATNLAALGAALVSLLPHP